MNEVFIIGIVIGIFAGIMAGMFGIGGGVVIVPALILISNFSITRANGTSLAALLLPVGILAVIKYYKSGLIDLKISLFIAIGLMLGVVFGAKIALSIPNGALKIAYGIFLLYVSWAFIKPKGLFGFSLKKKLDGVSASEENTIERKYRFYIFIALGFLAGILSGMFGIGGGLVIVPFLVTFLKFDTKKAVGTSLGALLLPVGLPGVILYSQSGGMNIMDALPVAIGILFGAFFGAKITIAMPVQTVKRVYGAFLLIMSLNFLYQGIIQ